MLKKEVASGARGRVIVADSAAQLVEADTGAILVAGSHGGLSAGTFATKVPLQAVFFNDAGVGKEGAGIAALAMLEARGIAAGAVSHTSARIGDGMDVWESGVISHVNAQARALGLAPGAGLRDALLKLIG